MLHICKMDYIKDMSREQKLEQLGPGVVKEYSPLNPRHLEEKCLESSRLRPLYPPSTGANSVQPIEDATFSLVPTQAIELNASSP